MISIFYYVFDFISGSDESLFFTASFGAVISFGILNIFFSLFKTDYGATKKLRYPFFFSAVCFLNAFYSSVNDGKPYFLITLFLGLLFSSLSFGIRVKSRKPLEKDGENFENELKVIDLAEKRIYGEPPETYTVKEPFYREEPAPQARRNSALDVSHVKNVIERLSYFPLSVSERKQINELSSLILIAERNGDSVAKEKLNEKLSLLLKIMAKYGA